MNTLEVKVGKLIMDLPQATANVSVNLILGMKPIQMLIAERKIKFIYKAKNLPPTSHVNVCWVNNTVN